MCCDAHLLACNLCLLCVICPALLGHVCKEFRHDSHYCKTTVSAKPETVKRDWFVVDATDKVLGRLATELARRLRGKHKPDFTPHVDNGDYIVVINAGKVAVTRAKADKKVYHSYSGYQSGLKTVTFKDLLARHPERIIETAVRGMLPKGPLDAP